MNSSDIVAARRWFADELRHVAQLRSAAVIDAFATVPRERFAGPGPWRLLSPQYTGQYWTTDDDDARHLYHDVLVAIDETRKLNNGQPSLWAFLYDQLALAPGEHVMHIGTGTGYYTGILAQIVGRQGHVTGIEFDAELAARAQANLAHDWPQARIVAADGFAYRADRPADVIIVNAGVTHISLTWLDALAEQNGRLLVPMTDAQRYGACMLITRRNGNAICYGARNLCRIGIFGCVGGRTQEAEDRLGLALRRSHYAPPVQSLRRPPDEPDETCWLAGDGWWLSMAPASGET